MSNDPMNSPPLLAAVERLRQATQNLSRDGHNSQPARNKWVEPSSQALEQTIEFALKKALAQFRTEIEETRAVHQRELIHAIESTTLKLSDGERQTLVEEVVGRCHNRAARATFWLLTLLLIATAFVAGVVYAEGVLAWLGSDELAGFLPSSLRLGDWLEN